MSITEIRGVLCQLFLVVVLSFVDCQRLDVFRGKRSKRLSFPTSTVCFSLSQSVRGNKDNGYNRILAVLERHWGLNKGSHQK